MAKDTPLGKGIIKIEADLTALERSLAEARSKIQAEPSAAGLPVGATGSGGGALPPPEDRGGKRTKDFGVGSSRSGTVRETLDAAKELEQHEQRIAEAKQRQGRAQEGIKNAYKETVKTQRESVNLATEETQQSVEREVKITRQIALARQLAEGFMAVVDGIAAYGGGAYEVAENLGSISQKFSILNNLSIDSFTKQTRATEDSRDAMLRKIDEEMRRWHLYKDLLDDIDTALLGAPEQKGYLREIVEGKIADATSSKQQIDNASDAKLAAIAAEKESAITAARDVVKAENEELQRKLDIGDDIYKKLESKRAETQAALDKRIADAADKRIADELRKTKDLVDQQFDQELDKLDEIEAEKKKKEAERTTDQADRIAYENERKRIRMIKDDKQRAAAELALEEKRINKEIAEADTDVVKDALQERLQVLRDEFVLTIQEANDELMKKQREQFAELRNQINNVFNTGSLEVGMTRVASLIQVLIDKTGR